ncbi:MAG: hypothetical protein QOE56_228 [Solirubrobacterales bacterium]|jgi:hypothetical protein|nr:hypothetical protein [Solirubrobacterales bacterium]
MPDLLDRDSFAALGTPVDERLARAQLRGQIARLERALAGLHGDAFGRVEVEQPQPPSATHGEPRLLDLGGLEAVRDRLATRVADARQILARRDQTEDDNRELLRAMLAAPAEFKWVVISRSDVGEPGCGGWHSRPRLGPIGLLMGWWRVKVSSGCPLAGRLAAVEQKAQAEEQGKGQGSKPPSDAESDVWAGPCSATA